MTTRSGLIAWAAAQTRDYNQLCQAFLYQACRAFGAAPVVYPSARAAKLATRIESLSPDVAPIGKIGYWNLGAVDHVAISLGGGEWLMGSAHAVTAVGSPPHHIGIATSAQYRAATGATFAGWGSSNGANTILVTADPAPALTTQQRRVKATAKVNRRTGPGTGYPTTGADLAANTIGNFVAFAHGPASHGQPAGDDVWYQGVSGDWFWAGGFTTIDGTGLVDKTAQFADPAPVPVPPVVVAPPTVTPPPIVAPPVVTTPPATTPPVVTPVTPPVAPKPVEIVDLAARASISANTKLIIGLIAALIAAASGLVASLTGLLPH